jgi:hypothetical protein
MVGTDDIEITGNDFMGALSPIPQSREVGSSKVAGILPDVIQGSPTDAPTSPMATALVVQIKPDRDLMYTA